MVKSTWLIIIGALLLLTGLFVPLATLIVDDTAPIFGSSVPDVDMTVASITQIFVRVGDAESGINNVDITIDGTKVSMNKDTVFTDPFWTLWTQNPTAIPSTNTVGAHTFMFEAFNTVGLRSAKQGTYTIYTALQGKWYINNVEITSSTQVVKATSRTITFKFVKSAGISDSLITSTITWAGGSYTVPYSSASTWQGSYTFATGGTYSLALTANDGSRTVTMSIVDLQLGEILPPIALPDWSPLKYCVVFGGVALVGVGLVYRRKRQ